ncbi:hypothetical protein SAMN05216338_10638 [Bradyrhizobium sp. Rc2d]|nr:hypothetical protein SAMN05216338_10638 [Bradyrhizobium sp. Rc2d]
MDRPAVVKTITVILYGVAYHGTYFVHNSIVYVQSTFGSKATQLGTSPPELVAKLLLSELVRERVPATDR